MKTFVYGLRRIVAVAVAAAAVSALIGFLVANYGHLGAGASGVGWGMCIGGALLALVVGQSGSPSRMALEGRWGAFGQYWGGNAALPQSPLWTMASALLVFAGGIAVIVVSY